MEKEKIKLTQTQKALLLAKFNKTISNDIEVEINPIQLNKVFIFMANIE